MCDDGDVALLWGLVDAVRGDEPVTFQLFVGAAPGRRPARVPPRQGPGAHRRAGRWRAATGWPTTPWSTPTSRSPCCTWWPRTRRSRCAGRSCSSTPTARWCSTRRLILKLFRRIEPGPNPDVVITRELAARGIPHVLAPLAELHRDGTDLAVLREFLVGATEGWELARTSMRDVLASRVPPEEAAATSPPTASASAPCSASSTATWPRCGAPSPATPPRGSPRWRSSSRRWPARPATTSPAGSTRPVPAGTGASARSPTSAARSGSTATSTWPRSSGSTTAGGCSTSRASRPVAGTTGSPRRRRCATSPAILRSLHYAAATGLGDWDTADGELAELAVPGRPATREAFLAGTSGGRAGGAAAPRRGRPDPGLGPSSSTRPSTSWPTSSPTAPDQVHPHRGDRPPAEGAVCVSVHQ